MYKNYACHILSFHLLYVNGNAQNYSFLLLNGTQYARPKNGGMQYARPKKGGTQYARGRGCRPLVYGKTGCTTLKVPQK